MNNCLLISDAAKEVKVESHVLRYWEEELHLPIKRNELGHRYYTEADVQRFKQIKSMKERGLQLKAIKMILKDGRLDVLPESATPENISGESVAVAELERVDETERPAMAIDIVQKAPKASMTPTEQGGVSTLQESPEEKSRKLQWVLQEMIRQAVRENNVELCRELKESVIKELDYQFRMQEERDEIRDKRLAERDEEYYKRMDELLRRKSRYQKTVKKGKNSGETEENMVADIGYAGAEGAEPILCGEKHRGNALKPEKKKRHFF